MVGRHHEFGSTGWIGCWKHSFYSSHFIHIKRLLHDTLIAQAIYRL